MKHLHSLVTVAPLGFAFFGVLHATGCRSAPDRAHEEQTTAANTPDDAGAFGTEIPTPDASAAPEVTRDPETCEEARATRSYVGCDYWPTVTANAVWSIFDFAVVVANTSKTAATVTVTGPNAVNLTLTVAPGALEKVYLPWVPSLKGPDSDFRSNIFAMTASVAEAGGAYHLVSSVPVVAYQFNALEYKGEGGPADKDWSKCPNPVSCFSFTNDASLLLPSTAWTKNYRVTGMKGWSMPGFSAPPEVMGTFITITAVQNATTVTVSLASGGEVLAGNNIPATKGGGTMALVLDAGDVVELVTPKGAQYDFSGSLVQGDKPLQVITGAPCIYLPWDKGSCDHIEESVIPAEALGKRYVVTTPTRPKGGPGIHIVRFYGNRDGTTLTYSPSKPPECPSSLAAGQVVECGPLWTDFVVTANQEFGISSFQVGSSVDPSATDPRGDPSQSTFGSTEQFRTSYLFLAPDDYDVSYAVVTGPADANPKIDGVPLSGFATIAYGFGAWRPVLGKGTKGAHKLTSDKPVGLQVMGYGNYTSYQYPGGLNLKAIAPPPAVPK